MRGLGFATQATMLRVLHASDWDRARAIWAEIEIWKLENWPQHTSALESAFPDYEDERSPVPHRPGEKLINTAWMTRSEDWLDAIAQFLSLLDMQVLKLDDSFKLPRKCVSAPHFIQRKSF